MTNDFSLRSFGTVSVAFKQVFFLDFENCSCLIIALFEIIFSRKSKKAFDHNFARESKLCKWNDWYKQQNNFFIAKIIAKVWKCASNQLIALANIKNNEINKNKQINK